MLSILAIVGGLALLVWSADRFVEGASGTAKYLGLPPLLIGMVIVGFGTSAPEMVVSVLAASEGNPGLALGNAYGSNITNIALILGLVALISPIKVQSQVLHKELPILAGVTLLAAWQLWDGYLSRTDAAVLLLVFVGVMTWSIVQGMRNRADSLSVEMSTELDARPLPLKNAIIWLLVGLLVLIVSSRILVWGAVNIAQTLGVSDLIIGLTIVAVGTSLPELASSLIAIRKNEHDLALGNVLGSNLFNTLAVVGLAAAIHPLEVEAAVLYRDWALMAGLTMALFIFGYGFKKQGRIGRIEGGLMVATFVAYSGYLIYFTIMAR